MRSSVEFILGSREAAYTLIGPDDPNEVEDETVLHNHNGQMLM